MRYQMLSLGFLTATILLSSCAQQQITPYLIDIKHMQCQEFVQSNPNPLTFTAGPWHPISDCDTFTAFPPDQTAEALRQYRAYQAGQNAILAPVTK